MSEIYSWFKYSGRSPLSCLVRGYISEHAQKPLKWFLTNNNKRWFNWKTYLMSWKNYLADAI